MLSKYLDAVLQIADFCFPQTNRFFNQINRRNMPISRVGKNRLDFHYQFHGFYLPEFSGVFTFLKMYFKSICREPIKVQLLYLEAQTSQFQAFC